MFFLFDDGRRGEVFAISDAQCAPVVTPLCSYSYLQKAPDGSHVAVCVPSWPMRALRTQR